MTNGCDKDGHGPTATPKQETKETKPKGGTKKRTGR